MRMQPQIDFAREFAVPCLKNIYSELGEGLDHG